MANGRPAKPLLFKLTSLALVVTLFSVTVTTFFMARFAQNEFRKQAEADLFADAQIIRFALAEKLANAPLLPGDLQREIAVLSLESKRLVAVYDGEGNALADTIRADVAVKRDYLSVELPLNDQGSLVVAIETKEIQGMVRGLVRGSAFIGLLASLAAFSIAYFWTKALTNPIGDLLSAVRHLVNKQFGRKVLVSSQDELGQLGRAFNELSEMLEELFFTISDQESKLKAILSSMNDGVLAVDMGGKIILANKAVSDFFNVDPEEIIGKNQLEATRNEELCELLESTMDLGESLATEVQLRPGSERVLAVTSSFLADEKAKGLGAVAVLRDITSLRHLEQIRQEFVANVSHELRTPLTSIKGFVETILHGDISDQEVLRRFLTIINNETDRMVFLINDLLDLSQIESGIPLQKGSVDMKKVFDDTVAILQTKAEAKNVSLENNIYEEALVEGDEKLLRQVAINLVDNGVKYTPAGGKVWIEAEQGLESVEFLVSDNGEGIPAKHLERVFERFYRVDKGRSRQMGGTGLGLAISKHIVDRHRGSICAERRSGRGTRMRLTLKRTI